MADRRFLASLTGPRPPRGRVSRRGALQLFGLAGLGATGAIGVGAATMTAEGSDAPAMSTPGQHDGAASPAAPIIREFVLTASEIDWELMPGTRVRAWTYNGQMPGPELRVTEGDRVRVTLRNQLPVPTTIHWHGLNVPNAMDGVAGLNQAPVPPGQEFVYEFTATPAGSRWYHSHTDPAMQVPMGLYGAFIVEPRQPARAYDREYLCFLAEWDEELTPAVAAGTTGRGPRDRALRGGELGSDFFLVNGRMHGAVPPIRIATGERILLRLMHAGALPHAFHTHGHAFKIVATDGFPVPETAQLTKDTILIGPAERYDLELVGDNPGVWMVHCHMEHHMANGMMTLLAYDGYQPTGPAAAVVEQQDATHAHAGAHGTSDPAQATPGTTTPAATPDAAASPADGSVNQVTMVDDRFEPVELTVPVGTTVRWVNRGADFHSVAAMDGSFRADRIAPGDSYSFRFTRPGAYPYICQHHGLQGMTGAITVDAA